MSADREKILGLPLGPRKKKSSTPRAVAIGGALAVAPFVPALVERTSGLIRKGRSTVEGATKATETISKVQDAASEHRGPLGKIGAVLGAVSGRDEGTPKLSHLIEQHTDIAVPKSTAYNQWTQLEMFATIAKGVESVEKKDRATSEWTAKIGPSRREWRAEVTQQVPDERIAWKSNGRPAMKGVVTFHELDDALTRVLVEIDYSPSGFVEVVGNTLRIQRRRVKRDLRLFKHFVELRGEETGAWRGRIAKKDEREKEAS